MSNRQNLDLRLSLLHQALRAAKWRRFIITTLTALIFMSPMALRFDGAFAWIIYPLAVVVIGWVFLSACQEIAQCEESIFNFFQENPSYAAMHGDTWKGLGASQATQVNAKLAKFFGALLLLAYWGSFIGMVFFSRVGGVVIIAIPLIAYIVLGIWFSAAFFKNLALYNKARSNEETIRDGD